MYWRNAQLTESHNDKQYICKLFILFFRMEEVNYTQVVKLNLQV